MSADNDRDAPPSPSRAAAEHAEAQERDDRRVVPQNTSAMSATERLEASRSQMREFLVATPAEARRALRATRQPAVAGETTRPPSRWGQRLRAVPALQAVSDAVGGWWQHHPMSGVAALGHDAANQALRPTAGRHPVMLMLGAVAFGALFVRLRAWRLLPWRAVVVGVATRAITQGMKRVPMSAVAAAMAGWRGRAAEVGERLKRARRRGDTTMAPEALDPNPSIRLNGSGRYGDGARPPL